MENKDEQETELAEIVSENRHWIGAINSEQSNTNPPSLYDYKLSLSTNAILSSSLYSSSASPSLVSYTMQQQADLLQQQQSNALIGLRLACPSLLTDVGIDDGGSGEEESDDIDDMVESEDMLRASKPFFDNPLALINFNADLGKFLDCKRISDAVRMITKDFPELPSKRRTPYASGLQLSDLEKDELARKRNRDNAILTRKRQRIYSDFLDNAIDQLSGLIVQGDKAKDSNKDVSLIDMQGLISVDSMDVVFDNTCVSGTNMHAQSHQPLSFIPKEMSSDTLASLIGMSGVSKSIHYQQQLMEDVDVGVHQLNSKDHSVPITCNSDSPPGREAATSSACNEEREDSSSTMTLPSCFFSQTEHEDMSLNDSIPI